MRSSTTAGVQLRAASPLTRRQAVVSSAALAGVAALGWEAARANTQEPVQPQAGRADANGRFADKVVLITGATSGIGEATATAFALAGARVFFCGRREPLGQAVEAAIRARGGEATYLRADVREEAQIAALVEGCLATYGRLDIAFNNAGIETPTPAPLAEQATDVWDDVQATNARGVFLSMKYEIPVMLGQGGGIIVNTGSVSSHVGYGTIAPYNASKHAIWSLTRVASLDYAAENIRVNMVSPGACDTPMLARALAGFGTTMAETAATIPIGRITTPEEIARIVMFLSSDDASTLSGMDIDATGGMLSQ